MFQSPGFRQNLEGGISDLWIPDQSIIERNCHNSRTGDDIDIKHGPVTKKMTMTPYRTSVTSLTFFQFTAILEPSGSRIPDAYSGKLIFSLTVFFYLTKIENITKKSLT